MDTTPKEKKKVLSLGRRLSNRSRDPVKAASSSIEAITRSPTVISISSESSTNSTPPHRKLNYDTDYSPTPLDRSFSPASILSQSIVTNSPEVDWKWGENSHVGAKTNSVRRRSGRHKNTENQKASNNTLTRHKINFDTRKEEQRKAAESEMRKSEKIKFDNIFKRIKEQLGSEKSTSNVNHEANTSKIDQVPFFHVQPSSSSNFRPRASTTSSIVASSLISKQPAPSLIPCSSTNSSGYSSNNNNDNIIDLLNDSDSDGLLLEASQKAELTITSKKGNALGTNSRNESNCKINKKPSAMHEFLHDSFDDWFVSLDTDLLASQSAKISRSTFQRYNSLPVSSAVTATKTVAPQTPSDLNLNRRTTSSTLSQGSSITVDVTELLKQKIKENVTVIKSGRLRGFKKILNPTIIRK